MDLNKLERFSKEARKKLLGIVASKLDYVLSFDSVELREKSDQVLELKQELSKKGKEALIEEVAYTWFNRFVALRFMDSRGYTGIMTVSPLPGRTQPEILEVFKGGHCPDDIPVEERKRLYRILDGSIPSRDSQNEVYRFLLIGVCNSWHKRMPFMFQKLQDHTELLMPDDLLSEHSILAEINEQITDEDCQDVEIIGWMYQFYVSERKDEVIGSKEKIKAEDIPAATELFTPHWIVRYLVENSLGRLWMLNRPASRLEEAMDYYISRDGETERDFLRVGSPEEITVCDPACGSGHMLTYAFDLLTRIYEEEGYDRPEIARLILQKNLFGMEIDRRAAALAAFALTMKARHYDRRFFRNGMLQPNIICLEKVAFDERELEDYSKKIGKDLYTDELEETLQSFENIDSIGSLLTPALLSPEYFLRQLEKKDFQDNWVLKITQEKVLSVLRQACYLARKYHCVVANPPYMGNKNQNDFLKEFARKKYPDSKSDLFAMFIERGFELVFEKGYNSMVTMQSWMFLSSFGTLRQKLLKEVTIETMVHMANMVMGIAFGTSATVWNKRFKPDFKGKFSYVNYKDLDDEKKPFEFPVKNERLSIASASDFKKIPSSPIAYWVTERVRRIFEGSQSLSPVCKPAQGLATGDNDRFVRNWHEVCFSTIGFSFPNRNQAKISCLKWFPYNKGGTFRRWYGNQDFVVNWENDGYRIKNFSDESGRLRSRPQNLETYFKESISWSKISSGSPAFRYFPSGFIYDVAGTSIFCDDPSLMFRAIGYCNSRVTKKFLEILSPTLNFEVGHVASLPIIPRAGSMTISQRLIGKSKQDWDSCETSWDFNTFPLIDPEHRRSSIKATYQNLRAHWQGMTLEMQRLEEENNRIFIDAYGLQDELTPDVPLEEITLTCNPYYRYGNKKSDPELESLLLADTMREFLSYAVGCMFGRYSLDRPGLILANQGETADDYIKKVDLPKEEISFVPDEDNVLPITEGEYFADDIVARFKKFLRVTFGDEYYEKNLAFIERALGKDIRKYFLSDFYSHHVRMYKKRPIYWLFSSPRKTFNALIYMHRYNPDTANTVLNEYLRPLIRKLEAEKKMIETRKSSGRLSVREMAQAEKELGVIMRQIRELYDYEQNVLYPVAAKRMEIDLDDGVKANYPKFGRALFQLQL
ncbi:MAG TPA: BREX-1 system adenine-specific DNA-methyltransferase PglX [Synergistales bacterium]|nr:BREX-1 system adenine-specific DNA-methyltransferase PglX [Synergistales bacterium]HPC76308.1 BREX-1 system adenine-specific DNA-methyltransferase PglX [Synergistales bacterium]HRS48906.1 BREX-1 system adenine-specific DNA-methyltransferase PglX [Thermovirgaceae bacterium]HRU91162.1 BREX-1 system adenine-specific DNA-methyltransferase PglX [Thermovirgaceae bacterium]